MENIILIGHGSPRKEANDYDLVGRLVHQALHPACPDNCVQVAYLQYGSPSLSEAIERCVAAGARSIVIHPYFLASGVHVTRDIPALIAEAVSGNREVRFVYTEPLGIHKKIIDVVIERIEVARGLPPGGIEAKSFALIEGETDLSGLAPCELPLVRRVIHATGDFSFRDTLVFHPEAVKRGIESVRSGGDIVTDVEMVRAGISERLLAPFGGKVVCRLPKEEGRLNGAETRSEAGIETALRENGNIGIVAVGNAPTALFKVISLLNENPSPKPLVIGVPVGFVRALEAKALLAKQAFPFITNLDRKGGSPVAAALVNGILKMAGEKP